MKSDFTIIEDKGIFRKFYHEKHDAEQERYIYNRKLSITPQLINSGYIDNREYNDFEYLDCCCLWQIENIDFEEVADLYSQLHEQKNEDGRVICQIDTNPRNVIYELSEERYYLIDFVDWRWEYPEFDLIHFLMFWAEAMPNHRFESIRQSYLHGYLKRAEIDHERWIRMFPEVLQYFKHRRRLYGKIEKNNNPDQLKNREGIFNL